MFNIFLTVFLGTLSAGLFFALFASLFFDISIDIRKKDRKEQRDLIDIMKRGNSIVNESGSTIAPSKALPTQYLKCKDYPQCWEREKLHKFFFKNRLTGKPKGMSDPVYHLWKNRLSSKNIEELENYVKEFCEVYPPLSLNNFMNFEYNTYRGPSELSVFVKAGILFPSEIDFVPVVLTSLNNELNPNFWEHLQNCGANLFAKDLEGYNLLDKVCRFKDSSTSDYNLNQHLHGMNYWVNAIHYLVIDKDFFVSEKNKEIILGVLRKSNHGDKADDLIIYFAKKEREIISQAIGIAKSSSANKKKI